MIKQSLLILFLALTGCTSIAFEKAEGRCVDLCSELDQKMVKVVKVHMISVDETFTSYKCICDKSEIWLD